jgi:aminobenzoyl-glutamate utilization protein B
VTRSPRAPHLLPAVVTVLLAAAGAAERRAAAPPAAPGEVPSRARGRPAAGVTDDARAGVLAAIDAARDRHEDVARRIWEFAEVGYRETRSSKLLQDTLRAAGFRVEAGVAGMPTAFVAEHGGGRPVIGLLAEFDALPGISQDAAPERRPIAGKDAGHACGHHLFGAGSAAAAIAVRDWMKRAGIRGTLRVYGTPAEEGGAGKVYMVRAGLFRDADAVLHWHPDDENDASPDTSLSNLSAKFRFRGQSAHAAAAPERGRSALDGVEAMNHMTNLLREHVPEQARLHYVITSGGAAPNVVPDFAEVFYYVRHPDPAQVAALFARVVKAAEGAAIGTGTTVEHEVIHGAWPLLPNETLARVMDRNLRAVGGVEYTAADRLFAEKLRAGFPADAPPLERAAEILPFAGKDRRGSTDVGDVSWTVPTAGLRAATWVPGTAGHSWQAIAAGATGIGARGMLVAAKTLALTAIDLFSDPAILEEAAAERRRRVGPDFTYRPLLGDRPPPLDYRARPAAEAGG